MALTVVFDAPGHAALLERDLPPLATGQVRVRVEMSLVSSGTEKTLLHKSPKYPIEPGYSAVGRIIAVGPDVPHLSVGDRVVAHAPHASEVNCDHRFVLPLSENVRAEDAAFMAIGQMALFTVRLAALRMGDPLLILGQGLIGLVATQVARMMGAAPITVVDVVESRLELARRFGADRAFLASDADGLRTWLQSLPGGGPAASIELASGPQAVDTAIECTRRRGRVVTASLVPAGHSVNLFGRAWMEGLQLVGAYINSRPWRLDTTEVTSPWDWPVRPYDNGRYVESETDTTIGDASLFLRLLELGRFDLAPIVDEAVDGRDAADLFNRLPHSSSLGHLIRWA